MTGDPHTQSLHFPPGLGVGVTCPPMPPVATLLLVSDVRSLNNCIKTDVAKIFAVVSSSNIDFIRFTTGFCDNH